MIREVTRDAVTYNDPPMKFEAGTPGIVQQIGLGVALDYMMGLGMENIAAHERQIRDYARTRLAGLNWLQVQGNSVTKGAMFSFSLDGAAHAHDISTVLDKCGIAVRAGTQGGTWQSVVRTTSDAPTNGPSSSEPIAGGFISAATNLEAAG